jgi:ApbE superfamily uncharacterized protein (UPF0280 family)
MTPPSNVSPGFSMHFAKNCLNCVEAPSRAYVVWGTVARRMHDAVVPFAAGSFITPMAAVAGAVAEEVLDAMVQASDLDRAYVNNGGDIALHLGEGQCFTVGLVDRPDMSHLIGKTIIAASDTARGVATSGWRGRSFSRHC